MEIFGKLELSVLRVAIFRRLYQLNCVRNVHVKCDAEGKQDAFVPNGRDAFCSVNAINTLFLRVKLTLL